MDQNVAGGATADRAKRLFLYLRELALLRTRTIREVVDYEHVVWLSDVPAGAPIATAFSADDSDGIASWLEVDRVELPDVPPPPAELVPWLDRSELTRYDLDEPGIAEDRQESVPDDVLDIYADYVDDEWAPWSRRARQIAPAYEFYTDLFGMSERRQRLGEVYELVVGLGLVAWHRSGQRIQRHLITTPAEISVDADTGRVAVIPSTSEGRNRFEVDMLESEDQGSPQTNQDIRQEIEETDPLALLKRTETLLRRWTNRAHPSGQFSDVMERNSPGDQLRVATAPAIILRRRGHRSISELLDAVAVNLGGNDHLPEGVRQLVSTAEPTSGDQSSIAFSDPEVYFPLPSNDEQRQIVEKMTRSRGVLVQGPPGTGKSQSIANLISHLLAQGKRVLVTSHTERALRVLHDKLPDEIKPLCISLLGSDRDSISDLEAAVEEISVRHSNWSAIEAEARIAEIRATLERTRSDRSRTEAELRQLREGATHTITVGNYTGTTQSIAHELSAERIQLGWIPDSIKNPEPPLTDVEFSELERLVEELPETASNDAAAKLPALDQLMASVEFDRLVSAESLAETAMGEARERYGDTVKDLEALDLAMLQSAEMALRSLHDTVRELQVRRDWIVEALAAVLSGHPGSWLVRHKASTELLDQAQGISARAVRFELAGLKDHTVRESLAATNALIEHVEGGGKLRSGVFAPRTVKDCRWLLDGARIDGVAVSTPERLGLLRDRLEVEQCAEALSELWSHLLADGGEPLELQLARYEDANDDLGRVLDLAGAKHSAAEAMSSIPGMVPTDWGDLNELSLLLGATVSAIAFRRIDQTNAEFSRTREALGDDPHPSLNAVRRAIDDRDGDGYRAAVSELSRTVRVAAQHQRLEELSDRLENAAPVLNGIVASKNQDETDRHERVLSTAWTWREADTILGELLQPNASEVLNREIGDLTDSELSSLGELSGLLAWNRMFETLTSSEAQALAAWAVAVKKVGKGKGKYAERHRRTARTYMGKAKDAIPAWIMPMYRVAESLDAVPEAFDVVIVDEASQSSVESLFLFYLGKQIVVVGDDQQIAPEAVGIDQSSVYRLQEEYLEDVPYKELFSPDNSLFDQAKVRFPGSIVLREHFRCMPEIIQFSNEIAYRQQSLIPLRQYGEERLDPIKVVYLPHGHREGGRSAINRPEAAEIVERVAKICTDPAYNDLSIGVISLQGDSQAKLIERQLLDRIGPQEILARRIVCGDAYAFQGDERDIIFLSMVAAPNERIGALTRETAKRRFNVAASRARDQVWLVHSVTVHDLSANGMRRRLLEYYLDPKVTGPEEIGSLDPDVLHEVFDSRFEQDVYLKVQERGFRVTAQYPVANYRIDLVVEGMRGRLAVECDGDAWHGPDRWDADMARQRQLERVGWSFFRVSGSSFYRDPDGSLEPLWELLKRHGIEPNSGATPPLLPSTRTDPLGSESTSLEGRVAESRSTETGFPSRAEPVAESHPGIVPATPHITPPIREKARSASNSLDLSPGDQLRHARMGSAQVVRLLDTETPDDSMVEIRFEDGKQYQYTEAEYRRAGFSLKNGAGQETEPGVDAARVERGSGLMSQGARPGSVRRSDITKVDPRVGVLEHGAWEPSAVPDPRDASQTAIARVIGEVVDAEGPITTDRLYGLVVRAGGGSRVTQVVRDVLDRALAEVPGVDRRDFHNPHTPWPQTVIWLSSTPAAVVRTLGSRDLYEIPLDEVAAHMAFLDELRRLSSPTAAKRRILAAYGLKRLTPKVDQYLDAAMELLES